MSQKPVDGPVEVPTIGVDQFRYYAHDIRIYIECRMSRPDVLDARIKNASPQLFVQRMDFDRQPPAKARLHTFIQIFQLVWRPIPRDNDLPSGIHQSVQRMAKLMLNSLSLKELNIVNNQQINRTKILLERHKVLPLKRSDEPIHKLFCGEINNASPSFQASMRNRLN